MSRLDRLYAEMKGRGLRAFISVVPTNTYHLTGFRAKYYFRPIILVAADRPVLIIPDLELVNARASSTVDLRAYGDSGLGVGPLGKTALELAIDEAVRVLRDQGAADGPVGFEKHGFPFNGFVYLSKILDQAVPVENLVENIRMVKDDGEIERLRRAMSLAEYGLAKQLRMLRDGVTEMELMATANYEILLEGSRRYPDAVLWSDSRPLSGDKTALPHGWSTTKPVRNGEVVILVTDAAVDGYHAEAERTFIFGKASAEQKRVFQVLVDAQRAAIDVARPGVRGRVVDRAARAVVEKAGLLEYFLHRTGHAIGLEEHDESPYFSATDETPIEPGMVMSVEPGLYVPGVGGFCNADVFLVTDDGIEPMSHRYPDKAEELVIPAP